MKTTFRIIDSLLRLAISGCIAGIMLVIGFQVIARATVGAFSWPEELSVILMVWGLMLGAAYVLNERGHVGISALVDRCGPGPAALISALMHVLIICFSLTIIYGAIGKIGSVWHLKTGALGISRAIPNLVIPTSCAFFVLVSIRLIFEDISLWKATR